MNHNEEMKMLGYLKKIADNTGRIADALEKMVPPAPSEVKPVVKSTSVCVCLTCAHAFKSYNEEPCCLCKEYSRWEAKEK